MAQAQQAQPAEPEQEQDPSRTPPSKEEHPTTIWICENNRCRYYQVKRRVAWQHLGGGLYLVGQVRCLCGHLPMKAPRGTTTAA